MVPPIRGRGCSYHDGDSSYVTVTGGTSAAAAAAAGTVAADSVCQPECPAPTEAQ